LDHPVHEVGSESCADQSRLDASEIRERSFNVFSTASEDYISSKMSHFVSGVQNLNRVRRWLIFDCSHIAYKMTVRQMNEASTVDVRWLYLPTWSKYMY